MYVCKVAESAELFERVSHALENPRPTTIVMSQPTYMSTLVYPFYNYTSVRAGTLVQIHIRGLLRSEKMYFGLITLEDVDLLLFKALKSYNRTELVERLTDSTNYR